MINDMKKRFSAFYLENGSVVTVPHVEVALAKAIRGCGHPVDDAKHVTRDGMQSKVKVSLFYNGVDWHVLMDPKEHGTHTECIKRDARFYKASLNVDVMW